MDMAGLQVLVTDNAAEVLAVAGTFLRSEPVQHNLVLTLLEERSARPEPGRYWTVVDRGEVGGVAFQSPTTFHAAITPMRPGLVHALVESMAEAAPDLPGVFGDAGTASRFAGHWAEVRQVPATPVEGQRLYQLGSLVPPSGVPGHLRPARSEDADLVLSWTQGFQDETDGHPPPPDTIRRRISEGFVHVWEREEPMSMAVFTSPVAGVSRIGLVYTPRNHRRRGFGAACTAAISEAALGAGAEHCVLFTQLKNPRSNAIYRRLGYEAVAEQLRYAFAR